MSKDKKATILEMAGTYTCIRQHHVQLQHMQLSGQHAVLSILHKICTQARVHSCTVQVCSHLKRASLRTPLYHIASLCRHGHQASALSYAVFRMVLVCIYM